MANAQPQGPSSGREIALLIGVLFMVAAGSVATYWFRSGAEASSKTGTVTAAPAPAAPPAATAAKPRATAPAPIESEVHHLDVFFDFKSTRLRADAARLLQDKAGMMDQAGTWAVLVQGFADRQGPAEYNKRLAQQRADTVKQFLVELGVPETAVKAVTIGAEGAVCDDPSKECQQLNRRVHLEIRKLSRTSVTPVRPTLLVGDTLDTPHWGSRP